MGFTKFIIIVLQEGKTPLDLANKQTCVDILQAAMVC